MGGLALGFSTKALMKYSPVSIFPVSYDIDQYRALCRERIGSLKPVSQEDEEKLKEYIRKTRDLEGARKLLQEIPNYQQYRDTTSYLSAYATLLKGPKWKKEEEVRLCHWPITCTERNIPLLDTSMGANKPRAILQLDEVPLVSISTMDDKRTLQQKGFFNFLSKHNLNYLN